MFSLFRGTVLLALLLASSYAFSNERVELSVPAGRFSVVTAKQTEPSGHLNISITMLETFSSRTTWAPYAYVGFFGPDNKNSFRLFVSTDEQKPDGLVAGYEYLQGGEVVKRVGLIHSIPVGSKVDFSIFWNENVTFIFSLLGGKKLSITTHLRNVSQTLSVSGAHVVFH